MSYESDTVPDMLEVQSPEVDLSINIGNMLKDSVIGLFAEVTADQESHLEQDILEFLDVNPFSSVRSISRGVGLSITRTSTLLNRISSEYNNINVIWMPATKSGKPQKIYSLHGATLENTNTAAYRQNKVAIISYLLLNPPSTSTEIAKGIKKAVKSTTECLYQIIKEEKTVVCTEVIEGRGRPRKLYSLIGRTEA
jgi:hypothetical protein